MVLFIKLHIIQQVKFILEEKISSITGNKNSPKEAISLIDGPGRKPKYKVVTKESDWQTYYGSNKAVQGLIKEGKENEFSRQILKLCSSKKLLTYYEAKFLFMNEVLEYPDKYFNDNILGKFYTKDLVS